ncbi:MAG: hypothetical protein WCE64_02900 [Bacteroidales bacterium]
MKTRSVLVIIGTLLIGFFLGMLTSAQLRIHRLKPVRVFFSQERFREGFYKTIQPTDQQKAIIDQILDKYAKINSDMQATLRKEMESNFRAMRKELESNLTKDQLARLKEMDERRQAMMRNERQRHMNDTTDGMNDRRGRGEPPMYRQPRNPGRWRPAGPPPDHTPPDTTIPTR